MQVPAESRVWLKMSTWKTVEPGAYQPPVPFLRKMGITYAHDELISTFRRLYVIESISVQSIYVSAALAECQRHDDVQKRQTFNELNL